VYRSLGDDCIVDIHVRGETDTWLEWLPQETILFDRGRMWRSTAIDGWSGAMIMAGDILVFGRLAHGEVFQSGFLHDSWKVSWNGRLIWRDALRLDGDVTPLLDDPAGFAGAVSVGTFVYVADDAVRHLRVARDLLEGCQARCGVTSVNGVLVARFLASEPRVLRVAFGDFWAGFRQRVRGLPECLPRVWHG
jgi:urease accessory protein